MILFAIIGARLEIIEATTFFGMIITCWAIYVARRSDW